MKEGLQVESKEVTDPEAEESGYTEGSDEFTDSSDEFTGGSEEYSETENSSQQLPTPGSDIDQSHLKEHNKF